MSVCCAVIIPQKITTGNATAASWNISESKKVQKTLAVIISDHKMALSATNNEDSSKIPEYIRILFRHYCSKNDIPHFGGIEQIQHKMAVKLQKHIFIEIIDAKKEENTPIIAGDGKSKISEEKVRLLFPDALMYIDDQNEQKFI